MTAFFVFTKPCLEAYADIVIDGIEAGVKIDIRKSVEINKFWIHHMEIKKNPNTLSPALTQELKERMSSSENSKSRNKGDVNKKYSVNVET